MRCTLQTQTLAYTHIIYRFVCTRICVYVVFCTCDNRFEWKKKLVKGICILFFGFFPMLFIKKNYFNIVTHTNKKTHSLFNCSLKIPVMMQTEDGLKLKKKNNNISIQYFIHEKNKNTYTQIYGPLLLHFPCACLIWNIFNAINLYLYNLSWAILLFFFTRSCTKCYF